MIKFFRKIRYDLMGKNPTSAKTSAGAKTGKPASRTGRYFKYAVGEIVLVVLGILIALSINNWNENRKTQNNQEKYLILLKEEALKNIKSVKKAKESIESTMIAQRDLIKLIDGNQDTISEKYLSELFLKMFVFTTTLDYENSVFSELKTSGELKNIGNDSIRNSLVQLEPLVEGVKAHEKDVRLDYESAGKIIDEKGNRRTILDDNNLNNLLLFNKAIENTSNIPLLKNNEFKNHLINYSGTCYGIVNRSYPSLESHLITLVGIIDKELENIK